MVSRNRRLRSIEADAARRGPSWLRRGRPRTAGLPRLRGALFEAHVLDRVSGWDARLEGKRFWNATDACCNLDRKEGIDDVAYVSQIIDDVTARYNVDPKRIYLVGHSNGAFMSHRFACEMGSRVAAIVTLAGMQWNDPAKCPGGSPVSVLHVHGDADDTILYAGGVSEIGTYPSAKQTRRDVGREERMHRPRSHRPERRSTSTQSRARRRRSIATTLPGGRRALDDQRRRASPVVHFGVARGDVGFLEAHPKK